MEQEYGVIRYRYYAYRTEQTYCQWILCYIYHLGGKIHPNRLGANDVEFLNYQKFDLYVL